MSNERIKFVPFNHSCTKYVFGSNVSWSIFYCYVYDLGILDPIKTNESFQAIGHPAEWLKDWMSQNPPRVKCISRRVSEKIAVAFCQRHDIEPIELNFSIMYSDVPKDRAPFYNQYMASLENEFKRRNSL